MSSAAPPLPYPAGGPGSYDNGARRPSATPNGGGERVFDHLHDLQKMSRTGYDPRSSISHLLGLAETGLNQAQTLNDFRRPDLAFVEYLRAAEIVVNIIPHHKDYTHFTYDQQERVGKFKLLTKRIHGMDGQFEKIKAIIESNNLRHGVIPKAAQVTQRKESLPVSRNGHTASATGAASQKEKPVPSPKPNNLHGRALSTANPTTAPNHVSSGASDLNARFAQLRMTRTSESDASSIHSSAISKSTDPGDTARTSVDSWKSTSLQIARPNGPRSIPTGPPPVDTNIISMPQPPKAIYSPARNMQTSGNIAPPRYSARSLESSRRTTSTGNNSVASSYAPNGSSQSEDYFPVVPPRPSSRSTRRKSVSMPIETRISVERLYDYNQRYEIMFIDFRTREEFDDGHLYDRNVVCIEPLSIRQGMSAAELEESLVLSPDAEQDMFYNRDKYDLVVYYDRQTQSETYLSRPMGQGEAQLKWLHEALDVFNEDKPLQRPPMLMIGGLEAWSDLVGSQALLTSRTSDRSKPGRAIQRRPITTSAISRDSPLKVSKRRLHEYNPLTNEEETYYREAARVESMMLSAAASSVDEYAQGDEAVAVEDDDSSGAIQEFLERFPDAGSIDRHAFRGSMPVREPPKPPAKIPMYPATNAPSSVPSEPARPPPAAPRVSYTGVSEPANKQTINRTASGAPYVPPKLVVTNLRLARTGLENFGATCYMNATVQALCSTTSLSWYFLHDKFMSELQRTNWRSNSKGVMAELYANLIRSLWNADRNNNRSIRPTTFRKFCGRANTTYENDNVQQDAKEFLEFLLDCLHEDLNVEWSHTPLRALTEKEEAQRERMPKLVVAQTEWARYLHRDKSMIQEIFGGQHLSQLVCQTCHFTSSKYEFFSSLSVEIPDPRKLPNGRMPTLQDCLRSYCAEEILRSGEVWTCPRCKCPRETSKRITITRAPDTLIVHFKRFDHGGSGGTGRKKVIPVDFPLDNLDMRPYMLSPPSTEEARAIESGYGRHYLNPDDSMVPPYMYDASAVIRHHGSTLSSGHYTTIVNDRARKTWRMCNDTRTEDINPQQMGARMQSQEAYIVFYQRRPIGMSTTPEGHF
ncbi:ubiquitin carboxyl-terminal hydrolase 4 [Acrodontium crateriforme]|uniref:Ubiquitin carboxyl-terminal hydrolase 4 n=1 Tax=Acrodontium crateriforme TaxID=150365 RepID=A0AAQ3M4K2_9PEZI|nr:ubiquitin carboxyl-terminal hydrolase 4 [Acrodontium crateriforme]